jgi:hypothetical protein
MQFTLRIVQYSAHASYDRTRCGNLPLTALIASPIAFPPISSKAESQRDGTAVWNARAGRIAGS